MKNQRMKFLSVIFFIGILQCSVFSQDMPVPAQLQAVLFKKIFSFDKSLTGAPKVIVVFGDAGVKDQVVAAFTSAGISAAGAKVDQLSGLLGANVVVYVAPGASGVKAITAKAGCLSISGVPSLAESGQVAVAIGSEGGKPKIIVNMSQLKAEKQEMSADLLKMSKIIQ